MLSAIIVFFFWVKKKKNSSNRLMDLLKVTEGMNGRLQTWILIFWLQISFLFLCSIGVLCLFSFVFDSKHRSLLFFMIPFLISVILDFSRIKIWVFHRQQWVSFYRFGLLYNNQITTIVSLPIEIIFSVSSSPSLPHFPATPCLLSFKNSWYNWEKIILPLHKLLLFFNLK